MSTEVWEVHWAEFEEIVLPDELYSFSQDLISGSLSKKINQGTSDERADSIENIVDEIATSIKKLPIKRKEDCLQENVVQMRVKFPRAYEPWLEAEDEWLIRLFDETQNISEISTIFLRQPSSIRSRLKKLKIGST